MRFSKIALSISPMAWRSFVPLYPTFHDPLRRISARNLTSSPTPTTNLSHAPLTPLARTLHASQNPPTSTFLLGGPGSGKGTLSSLIVSRLRYHHVSVGALLRDEAKRSTPEARQILEAIKSGDFVPAITSTRLLLSHLANVTGPCVVDGFPRTLQNATLWESLGLRPRKVIALEVDETTMKSRLMARGREDDTPKVAVRRIAEFWVEWEAIKEFYRSRGLLVVIDGSGSPEQVWQRFKNMGNDFQM